MAKFRTKGVYRLFGRHAEPIGDFPTLAAAKSAAEGHSIVGYRQKWSSIREERWSDGRVTKTYWSEGDYRIELIDERASEPAKPPPAAEPRHLMSERDYAAGGGPRFEYKFGLTRSDTERLLLHPSREGILDEHRGWIEDNGFPTSASQLSRDKLLSLMSEW